jgi:acyl-CoA reductase-like NAD-dependent aldehyde dehydrogenase
MFKNFIGGEWVVGASVSRNVNPSDISDVVGEYAQADATQTRQAIAAARRAFSPWSLTPPQQRFDILDAAGTEIPARRAELGDLLAREEGKTLPEAIGEVQRAGNIFKFFAGEALRPGGKTMPSVRPGVGVEVTREPIGGVGIITPWNFPIAIPAWKIAPALAYGNCVVIKPADLVPASVWALCEILSRSGLPQGVLNLVMGRGCEVGATMLEDRGIDAITFTGPAATGHKVAQACVARMAKFQLEMGGKNPMIVLDDADLGVAIHCAVQSGFFSTGQRCTASSRVIVTDGVHDRFVAGVVEKMKTLRIDDARQAGTDIGPVVDATQQKQDLDYVEIARGEGAHVAFGGEAIERNAGGRSGFDMRPR